MFRSRPCSERASAALIFLVLLMVGAAIFRPILEIRPLHGDNLYALAWVDHAPITALLELDPAIYPEWRPLPYMTLWIEHRIVQLDVVAVHHVINLLLWVACAWLVYLLAVALSASKTISAFSALLLLVDERAVSAMTWIIERQTTLACCFGLAALLIVVRAGSRELRSVEAAVLGALLLAAALSKEYGLAFSGALAGHALLHRRRALAVTVVVAVLGYATLRLGTAGGAFAGYCEDMGFGFSVQERCMGSFSQAEVLQMAYNVSATGLGTLLPGLLDDQGMVHIHRRHLAAGIAVLFPFVAAVVADLPFSRTLALIPLFNAFLSFMVYRSRNQLVSAVAIAVVIALGGTLLRQHLRRTTAMTRAVVIAALVLGVVYLSREAVGTYHLVHRESASLRGTPPCNALLKGRPFAARFVTMVHERYGMSDIECVPSD